MLIRLCRSVRSGPSVLIRLCRRVSASQSCCAHAVGVSFTVLLRTRRGCQLHSPAAHTPCDESYKSTNNISDDVDDVEKGGEGEGEDAQRRKSNNPNLKGGEQGKATEHFHKSSNRHHHCRRSLFNKSHAKSVQASWGVVVWGAVPTSK